MSGRWWSGWSRACRGWYCFDDTRIRPLAEPADLPGAPAARRDAVRVPAELAGPPGTDPAGASARGRSRGGPDAGWLAELEVSAADGSWRADVMASSHDGSRRMAWEAGLSPIVDDDLGERTRRYTAEQIEVCWVTSRRAVPWLGSTPAIRVAEPDTDHDRWTVADGIARFDSHFAPLVNHVRC